MSSDEPEILREAGEIIGLFFSLFPFSAAATRGPVWDVWSCLILYKKKDQLMLKRQDCGAARVPFTYPLHQVRASKCPDDVWDHIRGSKTGQKPCRHTGTTPKYRPGTGRIVISTC